MEAGQELWTMWSLKEWAQEMPYYKFFLVYSKAMVPGRQSVALADINMTDAQEMPLFEEDNKDFETSPVQKSYSTSEGLGKRKAGVILGGANTGRGPSNARPTKISKTGSSQPSTKQAKAMVDISAAHATDKDLVDEGLEGDIAVRMQWSTRAVVRLAPHNKRVEFWEIEGPCQQCTTAKVAECCWYPQARLPCCRCLNSGIACKNSAGDMARNAQHWARVVRRREKKAGVLAARAARAPANDKEGPAAGPLNMTPAALPTLGAADKEEEVSGTGISGEPKLEEEDVSAPVAPEGAEGDRRLESVRSVWWPADEPASEFKRVTRRVGELRELEAGMADYAATCEWESAALHFKLLHLQTTLGETQRLQGALIEARQEAEEALWEISAFE
ncbi:hypothetical protein C0991_005336 [Blastosporella zonata]|nr:hypothetical protein C0991_005336 [Blastosporella zonata]